MLLNMFANLDTYKLHHFTVEIVFVVVVVVSGAIVIERESVV